MSEDIWDQFDRMRQSIGAHTHISRELADALTEGFSRVKAERDALAAHEEKCREAFEHLAEYWNGSEGSAAEDAAQHAMNVACDMLEESPATSLARLKAECWKEAYLAGMEHGHHWTVEGGYVPGDEEAAEEYVADRQAEGGES